MIFFRIVLLVVGLILPPAMLYYWWTGAYAWYWALGIFIIGDALVSLVYTALKEQ